MKTVYVIQTEDDLYYPFFPAYDLVFSSEADAFELLMSECEEFVFIAFNEVLHRYGSPKNTEEQAAMARLALRDVRWYAYEYLEAREIRPFTLID